MPLYLGLAAAGAVGYYLYQSNGQPKVALEQAELDAKKAVAYGQNQADRGRKSAEQLGQEAGAQFDKAGKRIDGAYDRAVDDAKTRVDQARSRFEQEKDVLDKKLANAGTQIQSGIDKADAKVEEAAGKTKKGVSSWFGSK